MGQLTGMASMPKNLADGKAAGWSPKTADEILEVQT